MQLLTLEEVKDYSFKISIVDFFFGSRKEKPKIKYLGVERKMPDSYLHQVIYDHKGCKWQIVKIEELEVIHFIPDNLF